jgi:hypothetical protein
MNVSSQTIISVVGILVGVVGILVAAVATVDTENFISEQYKRWNTEDRPKVVETISSDYHPGPGEPPDFIHYIASFTNQGIEDAIDVQIKIATTDLGHTLTRRLLPEQYGIRKLRNGETQSVTTLPGGHEDFLVVCIEYRNDRGMRFADPPTFYATPLWAGPESHGQRMQPTIRGVAPSDKAKLLDGFSCDKL